MDDLSNEELEQLLGVFREQALTVLEDMSQDILSLEHNNADAEAMARLRRSAHTIKGDSACIGLDGITEVSHRMEDLIEGVRERTLSIDARLVNVLLQALDEVRSAIGGEVVSDVRPDVLARILDSFAQVEETSTPPPENRSISESQSESGECESEDTTSLSEPASMALAERSELDPERPVVPDALVEIVKGCIDDGRQVYLHKARKIWASKVSTAIESEGCPVSLLFQISPDD